jgi:hypothetical protein
MITQESKSFTASVHERSLCAKFLITLFAMMLIVWWSPISVPPQMDFGPFYRSIRHILEGHSMYYVDSTLLTDSASLDALEGQFAFPGPPWYPVMFLPLGLLSPQKAALAWALINIVFLFGTMALALSRSSGKLLMGVFVVALLSAPTQGHLIIGQFTIFAGFGFVLALWASERQRNGLTALGLMLTLCRPHLGLPFVALFVFKGAITSRIASVALIRWGLVMCALFVGVPLAIQPTCFEDYLRYARALSGFRVYQVCDTCSSFPLWLSRARSVLGESAWGGRLLISAVTLLTLGIPLLSRRVTQRLFVSGAIFLTLFALPSIRNYDYVLLAPALAIVGTAALQEDFRGRRSLVSGMLLLSVLIAGVAPYALDRELQGRYLWLAPLAGYLAVVVLLLGGNGHNGANSEPNPESRGEGCALPEGAN